MAGDPGHTACSRSRTGGWSFLPAFEAVAIPGRRVGTRLNLDLTWGLVLIGSGILTVALTIAR